MCTCISFLVSTHQSFGLSKLHETDDQYPCSINGFLLSLEGYSAVRLINDIDHCIAKHPNAFKKECTHGRSCIHAKRNRRDRTQCKDLATKKSLFATQNAADFMYISFLDRAHCMLKQHQDISRERTFSNMQYESEYMSYQIFSHGEFWMKYHTLSHTHTSLKQELLSNEMYTISAEQFDSELLASQLVLDSESKHIAKTWRACKTSEAHGIKKDDMIYVEHILCIKLYCNHSSLCTAFRSSYRKLVEEDTKDSIRARHTRNYYWLGRHLNTALEFWGETESKNDRFYHCLQHRFLFDTFSHVFEIPISTTGKISVTQAFNDCGNGITLELSQDYATGSSHYLDVSTLSEFPSEREYLVECVCVTVSCQCMYMHMCSLQVMWSWRLPMCTPRGTTRGRVTRNM